MGDPEVTKQYALHSPIFVKRRKKTILLPEEQFLLAALSHKGQQPWAVNMGWPGWLLVCGDKGHICADVTGALLVLVTAPL